MGAIQQSINQVLGMGTVVAAGAKHFQDTKVQSEQASTQLGLKATVLEAERQAEKAAGTPVEKSASELAKMAKHAEQQGELALAGIDKTYPNTILGNRQKLKEIRGIKEATGDVYSGTREMGKMVDLIKKQEEANMKAQDKINAKQAQTMRRKKSYEEVYFGK